MIIFLNGSINSGRGIVAKLLAKELPNVALVEIDTLQEIITSMPLDQAILINLENVVSVIGSFVDKDFTVIVPYPLSEKNHAYMIDGLKDLNVEIRTLTLAPAMEKALSNRVARV